MLTDDHAVLETRLSSSHQRFLAYVLSDLGVTEAPLDCTKSGHHSATDPFMSRSRSDLQRFLGMSLRRHEISLFQVQFRQLAKRRRQNSQLPGLSSRNQRFFGKQTRTGKVGASTGDQGQESE